MLSHLRAIPLPLVLLLSFVQSGCARNPVTGQLELALISEAQEIQMGQQSAREVAATMGLVDDPALQEYVQGLGQRLAAESERPHLPWSFAVVDDPTPNAFALPGGPIFVTRGLMTLMGTEAQLVSVLGHEIGHVTARHAVVSLSRSQLTQIGLGVGGVLFPDLQQIGNIAGAGLELVFLGYGRDAERQADELGFQYSLNQGFDVREMAFVFESLQRASEIGRDGDESAVPSWLMTHPAPAERIQTVQQRLATLETSGSLRIGRQAYLEQIEGLVYGENPRNGFFQGGLFLHPELQFQLTFPNQWQTQNLSQAVIAVSPRQDAAIQLTMAQDASPEAATQRFLNQQGIQAGQSGRQNLNGIPAVVTSFRAQSQQQTIQGIVTFISHRGQVYQLLSFAPVQAYANFEGAFLQTIRSFGQLTDPATLARQPDTIGVMQTTERMTLPEFHRRFPSSISIEELAVLNQLSGTDATLPAGTWMKRVIRG
jgi:predicted Zn-dependent protease